MPNNPRSRRRAGKASRLSEKADDKIENYIASISQACWIVLGLCAAAVVLSTGRDEAAQYRRAQAELEAVDQHSAGLDRIYGAIAKEIDPRIKPAIVAVLQASAAEVGADIDTSAVQKSLQYFFVDEGPLGISFTGPPANLQKAIDKFLELPPYRVKVPSLISNPKEFSQLLSPILDQAGGKGRLIIGTEFQCNYANDQCQGEFAFKSADVSTQADRVRFYIDAKLLETDLRPYHVLGFETEAAARAGLSVPTVAAIQRELLGKDLDATFSYLANKIAEKEGSIKVFDFSFSGLAAYVAVPTGITLALAFLLMHLKELSCLQISSSAVKEQAAFFFYAHPVNSGAVAAMVLLAPFASQILVARMAYDSGAVTAGSVLFLAIVSGLFSIAVLRLRHSIMQKAVSANDAELGR